MDVFSLKKTAKVLEKIAESDGHFGWYGVVIRVDRLGVEPEIPTFYILKELVRLGYLRLDPPEGGNDAKYWITDKGCVFLNEQATSRQEIEKTGSSS